MRTNTLTPEELDRLDLDLAGGVDRGTKRSSEELEKGEKMRKK
jgi:hypothetical protein